eukprot:62112_1
MGKENSKSSTSNVVLSDEYFTDTNANINDNNSMITNKSWTGSSYNAYGNIRINSIETDTHYWKFKLIKINATICIGIVQSKYNQKVSKSFIDSEKGYGVDNKQYGNCLQWKENDIVQMTLDLKKKRMTLFKVCDTDNKYEIANIKTDVSIQYKMAVYLGFHGDCIQLLKYWKEKNIETKKDKKKETKRRLINDEDEKEKEEPPKKKRKIDTIYGYLVRINFNGNVLNTHQLTNEKLLIGRDTDESDICLSTDNLTLSRRQVEIRIDKQTQIAYITDLRSVNGTRIYKYLPKKDEESEAIEPIIKHQIQSGDYITFGAADSKIMFRFCFQLNELTTAKKK